MYCICWLLCHDVQAVDKFALRPWWENGIVGAPFHEVQLNVRVGHFAIVGSRSFILPVVREGYPWHFHLFARSGSVQYALWTRSHKEVMKKSFLVTSK